MWHTTFIFLKDRMNIRQRYKKTQRERERERERERTHTPYIFLKE
jgi:hypothetical protein